MKNVENLLRIGVDGRKKDTLHYKESMEGKMEVKILKKSQRDLNAT